jgi:Sigma-70 region 2
MENGTLSRSQADQVIKEEAALMGAARRNPEAFVLLYRRYLMPLYRYLYRRLSNAHDAEDLTTQVFIDVLEGLATNRYREGGCFLAKFPLRSLPLRPDCQYWRKPAPHGGTNPCGMPRTITRCWRASARDRRE